MNLDSGLLVALNVLVGSDEPENLISHDHVNRFLLDLVEAVDMEMIAHPQFFDVPTSKSKIGEEQVDDGGMTAQCVITTSHIAFHSWPLQNRFRLVVDSCKSYDPDRVLSTVREYFDVVRMSVQSLKYKNPSES